MDNSQNIYNQVVEAYLDLGSVNKVVNKYHISETKVRRILITEGLWSSRTSRQIGTMLETGLTTQEIADKLHTSVKTVEAYMPYRRGAYNASERSPAAAKSIAYRKRNKAVWQKQVSHTEDDSLQKIVLAQKGTKTQESQPDNKKPSSVMEKEPTIMLLHMELAGTESVDRQILSTYGKAKNGISRDILVPQNITLHALHYCIQRAFGWQNSHLHHFEYPQEIQEKLLDAVSGIENRLTSLSKLCGIYYRFPLQNQRIYYWDDDYDGKQSVKTWLRKKYTAPYRYDGISEHCIECKAAVFNASGKKQDGFETGVAELLERIPLGSLIFPEYSEIERDWESMVQALTQTALQAFNENVDAYWEKQSELILTSKLYRDNKPNALYAYEKAFREYKEFTSKFDPNLVPLSDTLVYRYDYGDDWKVRITCKAVYYTKTPWDYRGRWFIVPVSSSRIIEETEAYDSDNTPVDPTLREQIAQVDVCKRPVCIMADGLNVLDDVGGPAGFCRFLSTIHEGSSDEAEDCKNWGREKGWSGRRLLPSAIL